MYARIDPSAQLLSLASAQCSVISASQLTSLNFPLRAAERLVAQRHWQRLSTGIYQTSAADPSWSALAWAGVLLGGDQSRLGFAAAGHQWGLVNTPPRTITVLVPVGQVMADRDVWTFRREYPGTRDRRSPGNPPTTTIEDTVIDLCGESTQTEVLDVVTRAVQSRRTNAPRILSCVDRRQRVRHRRYLHELLDDVAEGAQSALELRYLQDVERAHYLPRGTRQVRAWRGRAFRDVRYDEFSTLVELDGQLHALDRHRDARRDNAALLEGEVTLRYGWQDVTESPCQVAWQIAAILSANGWSGSPDRCPRCVAASDADLRSW